jgi:H+/Cl- antiporter ClcA
LTANTAGWFERVNNLGRRCRADRHLLVTAGVLSVLIVVIGIFDVISTNVTIAAGNTESNPLVLWVQHHLDEWWFIPKITVHFLLALVILWLPTRRMIRNARIGVVLYTLVVAHNFHLAALAG